MAYTHDPDDITVQMTSDTTPSPNATSASSYLGDPYNPFKAFDHTVGNAYSWLSAFNPSMPQWLEFDFGEGISNAVNHYKITSLTAAAGVGALNSPRDWLFQGSNNGTSWDDLDSQADIEWAVEETKEFSFSNSVYYRHYRLYITDYNIYTGYPFLAIAEVELLFAEPPTADPGDRLVQYRRTRRPGLVAGV